MHTHKKPHVGAAPAPYHENLLKTKVSTRLLIQTFLLIIFGPGIFLGLKKIRCNKKFEPENIGKKEWLVKKIGYKSFNEGKLVL